MSILKYEDRTPRNIQKMYEYMIDSNKTDDRGIFGLGVNPFNAANEMLLVQFAAPRICASDLCFRCWNYT